MPTSYDAIADWYHTWAQDESAAGNGVLSAFLTFVGPVAGQQICELGCGQGRLTRLLAQQGGLITGVDSSAGMLAFARNAEAREPLGITYLHDDAQRLASLAGGQFDGVASFLALTDIPDLAAVLDEVRRVVRPGGWLAFAVPHPCFEAPNATWTTTEAGQLARTITGYFDEGFWRSTNAEGIRGKVGAYHRTLATYFNLLLTMGFRLDRIEEPHFSAMAVERVPSYGVLPTILLVRARRDGS